MFYQTVKSNYIKHYVVTEKMFFVKDVLEDSRMQKWVKIHSSDFFLKSLYYVELLTFVIEHEWNLRGK